MTDAAREGGVNCWGSLVCDGGGVYEGETVETGGVGGGAARSVQAAKAWKVLEIRWAVRGMDSATAWPR